MGFLSFLKRDKKDAGSLKIKIHREDGSNTYITNIQNDSTIKHSDGTVTSFITAKAVTVKENDMTDVGIEKPICFEIRKGEEDNVETVLRNATVDLLKEDGYTYLGRSFDGETIEKTRPTPRVNNYISELNDELKENTNNQESLDETVITNSIDILKKAMGEKNAERLSHPYLKNLSDNSKGTLEAYDGVNMKNGDILRIRDVNKVGKDADGRYLYTAYLKSYSEDNEDEIINNKARVPVVFTTLERLSDIAKKVDDKNLILGTLNMLSDGYNNNINEKGKCDISRLHDIGGIDLNGLKMPNTEDNISSIIISKINELKHDYMQNYKFRGWKKNLLG